MNVHRHPLCKVALCRINLVVRPGANVSKFRTSTRLFWLPNDGVKWKAEQKRAELALNSRGAGRGRSVQPSLMVELLLAFEPNGVGGEKQVRPVAPAF